MCAKTTFLRLNTGIVRQCTSDESLSVYLSASPSLQTRWAHRAVAALPSSHDGSARIAHHANHCLQLVTFARSFFLWEHRTHRTLRHHLCA